MIHQKNLYIYLIIGFVLLIPFKNNSQDLNYKYELEPSTLRQADELYETNYLSAKNSDLLLLQNSTTTKIAELKFTDETLDRVYDAINTNPNYIFHQFHIGDLNNDGIDDLIISETGDYKLILYYYSSKRKILSRTKLLEIEIGREQLIGNIYYLPVDCDGDNKLEVFMSLAVNYPGPRAYRGIFLLDPEDSDIKWFYPTADNIYNLLSFQNKDGNKFLVYSSSGVTNGIIYKDNSFYDEVERNNYKKIYDLKKSDINKMTRVIDADYSTDSVSVVKAIDINGSLMWAKEVGKNYSWSSIISTNSPKKELLVSVRHKRTTDNTKDFIRKVDPLSGNTLNKLIFRYLFILHQSFFITSFTIFRQMATKLYL